MSQIIPATAEYTHSGGPPGADVSTNLFADTATGITVGAVVSMSGNKLRNSTSRVMLLDELRFEVSASLDLPQPYAPTPQALQAVSGNGIAASIRLGRFKITSCMIPLPLFCKPKDRMTARAFLTPSAFSVEIGSYVWRPQKPICLHPQDGLQVDVGYPLPPGLVGVAGSGVYADRAAPYTVSATGVGRLVDAAPVNRYLPFISAYLPPFSDATVVTQATFESAASDLMNPNAEPLLVTDLLGQGCGILAPWGSTQPLPPPMVDIIDTAAAGMSYEAATIQIVNAGGLGGGADNHNFGVRDYLPFAHVFHPQTRSWDIKATLLPKAYLQVREKVTNPLAYVFWNMPPEYGGGTANAIGQYRYAVGMLGYYRVTPEMQRQYGGTL